MATIYLIAPLPVLNCDINDIYVGSTTRRLRQRWNGHKCNFGKWQNGVRGGCSSFRLFEKYGVENCTIIEVERCDVENKFQRERYYFDTIECVNEIRPFVSTQQHRMEKREYCKEWRKKNNKYCKEFDKIRRPSKSDCTRESVI